MKSRLCRIITGVSWEIFRWYPLKTMQRRLCIRLLAPPGVRKSSSLVQDTNLYHALIERKYYNVTLKDKNTGKLKTSLWSSGSYTVIKAFQFQSPAGMSLPNSPWAGIMTSYINSSCLGRDWWVTSLLGMEISKSFFYGVMFCMTSTKNKSF